MTNEDTIIDRYDATRHGHTFKVKYTENRYDKNRHRYHVTVSVDNRFVFDRGYCDGYAERSFYTEVGHVVMGYYDKRVFKEDVN